MKVETLVKAEITEKDWVVCWKCSYTTKVKGKTYYHSVGHPIGELILDETLKSNPNSDKLSFIGLNCPKTKVTVIYEPIN